MNKKIKTIFIGTPDFAVPSLEALIEQPNYEIALVITQADKKVGRKQALSPPAVKILAQKHNLEIEQAEKISDIYDKLVKLSPDLIVVVAYGQIIPKKILDLPSYACINVHGSLLPKYRGAACVQAAILNMDSETGISIMQMDEGLDTGPIIHQESIKLSGTETSASLSRDLSVLAAKILPTSLDRYILGELKAQAQDDGEASYVPMLKKSDALIDFSLDAKEVDAHIRAMTPWPGSFFEIDGLSIKLHRTGDIIGSKYYNTACLFSQSNKLFVQCADNSALEILELQVSGKAKTRAIDFIRGYSKYID